MPTQIAAITDLPPGMFTHNVGDSTFNWSSTSPSVSTGYLSPMSYTIPTGVTAIQGHRLVGSLELRLRPGSLVSSYRISCEFHLQYAVTTDSTIAVATLDFGTYSAGDYLLPFDVTFDSTGASSDPYGYSMWWEGLSVPAGHFVAGAYTNNYIICENSSLGKIRPNASTYVQVVLSEWDILCTVPSLTTGRVSVAVHPQQVALTMAAHDGTNYVSYTHSAPQSNIGSSDQNWDGPVTIDTGTPTEQGLTYLPNGRLVSTYVTSGTNHRSYSDNMGSSWQTPASLTNVGAMSTVTSSTEGVRFLSSGGAVTAYWQVNGQGDDSWDSATAVASGAGTYCGGTWLENGYGLLYTRSADSHVMWKVTEDLSNWSHSAVDTTLTGNVVSLTRHPSGTLCGLLWDSGTKTCRACRSNDRGATWEMDGSDIASIPALDQPPQLTVRGDILYACWYDGSPHYVASYDGGGTWN